VATRQELPRLLVFVNLDEVRLALLFRLVGREVMRTSRVRCDLRRRSPELRDSIVRGRSGGTLDELMVMLAALLGMLIGAERGGHFGASHGIVGRILGGICGGIGGLVLGIVGGAGCLLLLDAVQRWQLRRQPFPPPCENGCCTNASDFERCDIPDKVVQSFEGMASYGYRCCCGNVYGEGNESGLTVRCFRLLPNGTIRPYLRHGIFGSWKPDDRTGWRPRAAPGKPGAGNWIVIPLLMLITAAICSFVAWRDPTPLPPPLTKPIFVAAGTLLSFVIGCGVWFFQRPPKGERDLKARA
jgi:hypothetical protein